MDRKVNPQPRSRDFVESKPFGSSDLPGGLSGDLRIQSPLELFFAFIPYLWHPGSRFLIFRIFA
jgi:hypothetical protein